jgi:1-acyl-sn-glycerol-3-phosphate acyltransferase
VSRAEEAGTGAVTPVDGLPVGPEGDGHSASTRDAVVAGGPSGAKTRENEQPAEPPQRDRSRVHLLWYRFVQYLCAIVALVLMRWRASGRHHIPMAGGVLLVCNHVSFLDVFLVGFSLRRPLNYVARSTLFVPVLGGFIRSVGGFPIQREGIGASGMKETLRRLKAGGIVALFPEGTRSPDGELGPLKPGISVLASRLGVPVVPAGVAGLHESWPRSRPFPVPHPVRIHYGPPIMPDELTGLDAAAITELIRSRMLAVHQEAQLALRNDLAYC